MDHNRNFTILSSNFLSQLISQKLNHTNYLTWKHQIVTFIKSHHLYGDLNGTTHAPPEWIMREVKNAARQVQETVAKVNPEYETWMAHDQSLVAYITSALSEEVLEALMMMFQRLSCGMYSLPPRFLQLKRQFQDIKRRTRSILEYIHEIKNVSDRLAIIGHPVSGKDKSECWHNPQNKGKQVRRDNKAAGPTVSNTTTASNIPLNVQQLLMTTLSKVNLKQNEEGQWYVDFGAATHVTDDVGKLSSALPYLANGSVVTRDGFHHKISDAGNAHISMAHSSIPLKNVPVVPNVKKNIIFVSKHIDDTNSSVEFTPSSVYVKDARTKKTFAEGVRKGDMYIIEEAPKIWILHGNGVKG
ncbi:hypothetical protein EJ110_NYTH24004 [Nymphaea thermarum]|nr:hypothetical protein EJ110_NYTH24004 [Nymphaea thermarum]